MAVTDERVSRRRLLKRAGIGAAALGAGSMLTASSASAQHHGDETCVRVGGCGICQFQPECGPDCYCTIMVDGCCFCYQNNYCVNMAPCHHHSDCPPGWACLTTCCSQVGFGTLCWPPCGYANGVAVQGSGPMGGGGGGAQSEPEPDAPQHGHGGPKHG